MEVGCSCLILNFRGRTVMLDCGVDAAFTGTRALPYFDLVDPAEVDIVIITHFHLDHCGALPYFTERLDGFRGRIFATHPTIAVMRLHDGGSRFCRRRPNIAARHLSRRAALVIACIGDGGRRGAAVQQQVDQGQVPRSGRGVQRLRPVVVARVHVGTGIQQVGRGVQAAAARSLHTRRTRCGGNAEISAPRRGGHPRT
jgi:hypothetical protein